MIRFPQMSIAASVVNRILNVADEIESQRIATQALSVPSTPAVPDASVAGQQIDAKLEQGTPDVPAVDDPEAAAAATSIATGGTALEGLLGGGQGV